MFIMKAFGGNNVSLGEELKCSTLTTLTLGFPGSWRRVVIATVDPTDDAEDEVIE